MIAKEKIEDSIFYKDEIKKCAMKLLSEINDIESIDGYKYLEITDIYSSIDFYGEYYCSCCTNHEEYYFDFDTKLLYDEKARNFYLNKLKEKFENKERERIESAKAKRKVHYLKLKEEFEGDK